jgi:hypothetical protein
MKVNELIEKVHANFGRYVLGGIPCLPNNDGAFLSFICCLTATEALGGLVNPKGANRDRLGQFVSDYFPEPLRFQAERLWDLRNALVHGYSPGPAYKLTHHEQRAHLTTTADGLPVLNAEDFYAALVFAAKNYFDKLRGDAALQAAFVERLDDAKTSYLDVGSATINP